MSTVETFQWDMLDLSLVKRVSPEAGVNIAGVLVAEPDFYNAAMTGELRDHLYAVAEGKFTSASAVEMKQVLLWLKRAQSALRRFKQVRIDIYEINLKDVESVTFSQMRSVAVQLCLDPHFMEGTVAQAEYWTEKTGRESDFSRQTSLMVMWAQGEVTHATERWLDISLKAARIVQCQINLYRAHKDEVRHAPTPDVESWTVPVKKDVVPEKTNQQRRKAEARKMAQLRHKAGAARPAGATKKGKK